MLGGAEHLRIRFQHLGSLRHLRAQRVHVVGQHSKLTLRVGGVGVLHQRAGNVQAHLGKRFRKRLVHHVRGFVGTLVGKLGCHHVLLLVAVIQQVGVLHIVGVERHHVFAEALRDNHRGIVLARACPIDGVVFVGEHPVHLPAGSQRRYHLLTHVHLQRNKVALVAFVVVHHCNLQVIGVLEHVPAGQNVVPAEDGRQEH